MTIPQLTTEQLQAARAAATQARRQRAELKGQVRSGELTLSEAIEKASGDDVLAHVKVVDLLKSLPRVGEKRAAAVKDYLVAKGIPANRVYTEGKGSKQPVTKANECKGPKSAKVIACLQPDRRVDIELIGTKK